MRRICLLCIVPLAAGLLSGCGDPAPSVKLAPEKQMPDLSKMSAKQIQEMSEKDHAAGR